MTAWRFASVAAPGAGKKTTGTIDWQDSVLTGWDWPYTAIHGAEPGPAVLITAGVHPAEYPAIDSAIRVARALDPREVRGQVLVLPVIDPPAFWERRAFVCPLDGLNPNRVFPGKADGSFSERLAYHLTERLIAAADAYIDLHGGDVVEDLEAFSILQASGHAELDARSEALARSFGLPNLLINRYDPAASVQGTTIAAAAGRGVPAVLAEAGGCGLNQPEAVALLQGGIVNALRHLGVLPGGAAPVAEPRRFPKFIWPRTVGAGFFHPAVRVGDEVAAGQTLGHLQNLHGERVETVNAPVTGRVLFLTVSPAISKDGLVAGIGVAGD